MSGSLTNRGQAVIIVNKNFDLLKKRKGASKDYYNLMRMFFELGFRVKMAWNASAERIRGIVQEAASMDSNKNSECFVLAISSYGTETYSPGAGPNGVNLYEHAVYGSDAERVHLFELTQILEKEPCLIGKQKLCLIQACRKTDHVSKSLEDMVDPGIKLETFGDDESDSEDESTDSESEDVLKQYYKYDSGDERSSSPVHDTHHNDGSQDKRAETGILESATIDCPKDFLIVHPVQPHKISFRGAKGGSYFVRELFSHKKMLNKESVLTYLTKVAGSCAKMNIKYRMNGKDDQYKMCVTLTHRLTSDVAFYKNTFTKVPPEEVK